MTQEIRIKLTKRQSSAWRLLTNEEILALLYGGGKGGGKSVLFCLWVDYWARWLADYFGIKKPLKNPLPVGFIGRKQSVDFKHTTLETFKRIIPPDHYKIKEQQQEIIFGGKVKVFYGGLDDRKLINKFNSAEFAFFGIDQAEETERTDISVLQAALRLTHNSKVPPYKQFYSANPADCWLKPDFIDHPLNGYHFVPALWSDNEYLPPNYEETLINAFRYNAALLAAYKDGSWQALRALNALLSSQQIEDLRDQVHHYTERRGVIVCDPSLGGDECVIKAMVNYKAVEMRILHDRKPMIIAGEMVAMGERNKIPNYAADTTGGLGEAILDRIREIKPRSERFYLSYGTADDSYENGVNLKAQMCWNYMMKVVDKKIPYPEDEMTRNQILALRFKVVDSKGRIIMEKKDEVRKRLGQSPDRGETEIMGVWVLPQTEPIVSKDAWAEDYDGSNSEITVSVPSAMAA